MGGLRGFAAPGTLTWGRRRRDECEAVLRAQGAIEAEVERLVQTEVAARMPEIKAEAQVRLDAGRAQLFAQVTATLEQERQALLEKERARALEQASQQVEADGILGANQLAIEKAKAEARAEQQRQKAEEQARERERAAQAAAEQATILGRQSTGKGKSKAPPRPKLSFGLKFSAGL